jgi:hypothetical protein
LKKQQSFPHIGMIGLAVLVPVLSLFLTGCLYNTLERSYHPGSQDDAYHFGGYDISVIFNAVEIYNLYGVDSFRVNIESVYSEKIKDTSHIDSIPVLKIDSVSFTLANGQSLYPELQDYSPGFFTEYIWKRLHGPRYIFKRMIVPNDDPNLTFNFHAVLYDRKDQHKISEQKFEKALLLTERRRFYIK